MITPMQNRKRQRQQPQIIIGNVEIIDPPTYMTIRNHQWRKRHYQNPHRKQMKGKSRRKPPEATTCSEMTTTAGVQLMKPSRGEEDDDDDDDSSPNPPGEFSHHSGTYPKTSTPKESEDEQRSEADKRECTSTDISDDHRRKRGRRESTKSPTRMPKRWHESHKFDNKWTRSQEGSPG